MWQAYVSVLTAFITRLLRVPQMHVCTKEERGKNQTHTRALACTQINTCVLSLASAPIGKCTHAQRAPGEANVASVCLSTSVVVMVSRGHCSCLQPFQPHVPAVFHNVLKARGKFKLINFPRFLRKKSTKKLLSYKAGNDTNSDIRWFSPEGLPS